MALINIYVYIYLIEIDYMRENIFLSLYLLLYIYIWYLNLDGNNNSKNNIKLVTNLCPEGTYYNPPKGDHLWDYSYNLYLNSSDIQSAENITHQIREKGFSETIRQSYKNIMPRNAGHINILNFTKCKKYIFKFNSFPSFRGHLSYIHIIFNKISIKINNKLNTNRSFYYNLNYTHNINMITHSFNNYITKRYIHTNYPPLRGGWFPRRGYSLSSPPTTSWRLKIDKILDNDNDFWNRFAGIIDGDGYIQVRKINNVNILKTIEVKIHNRDIRLLNYILNKLHMGRIYRYKNNDYSKWIVSNTPEMYYIMNKLNGLIRIKVFNFKKGCECLNIIFKEANYIIKENDPYFAGLIDTDGSIVFNHSGNRIECNLEFKHNEYTSKLNLDNVIPNYIPYKYIRYQKDKKSIGFKYQNVNNMIFIYDYFMKNRLYCDFKFYRVSKILKFMEIRKYHKSSFESEEYLIYSEFLLDWIKYENPKWNKVKFVSKLRMKR